MGSLSSIKRRIDKLNSCLDINNIRVKKLIMSIDFDDDGNNANKYYVIFESNDTRQQITEVEYKKLLDKLPKPTDKIDVEIIDDDGKPINLDNNNIDK